MKKLSKTKTAMTYATALYDAAFEDGAADHVFSNVKDLAAILAEDSSFINFVANPMVPAGDKDGAIREVAEKMQWHGDMLRFVESVAENRRFGDLPQILEMYVHVYYSRNDIVEAEVESVKALTKGQSERLQAKLEKYLGKKVVIAYKIAPEIIGGLKIKFGSEMIDNSVVSKLNRLENIMKGVQ